MMMAFALGTLPSLMAIGFTSVMSSNKSKFSTVLARTMGVLVLFFGLYNINAAMNALALPSLSDLGNLQNNSVLASEDDQIQVIILEASARGYSPNYFKVKVGVPVRWEIEDIGTSGCTNAVIAQAFFDGEIKLTPGKTSVKEFIPEKVGKYKFSCWMGMVTGTIEVGDNDNEITESGSSKTIMGAPKTTGENTVKLSGFEDEEECNGSCGGRCDSPNCGYR
jgi:plastocyanin